MNLLKREESTDFIPGIASSALDARFGSLRRSRQPESDDGYYEHAQEKPATWGEDFSMEKDGDYGGASRADSHPDRIGGADRQVLHRKGKQEHAGGKRSQEKQRWPQAGETGCRLET